MNKKVVFTLGRFNPPTIGHAKLIHSVERLAKEHKADSRIFTTVSHDKTKNPLAYSDKIGFLKKLFPSSTIIDDSKIRTIYQACHYLSDQGYRDVVLVVGEDRVSEFQKIWDYVRKPHDKDYDKTKHFLFDRFHVVSAGKRDSKSKGVTGASGTKMREYAKNNDFQSFMKISPTSNIQLARKLYRATQKGLTEEVQSLNEGIHDHGIFKVVFLAGGPGSGKDFILAKILGGSGLSELNSDTAFEMLLEKHKISKIMRDNDPRRDAVRGRAKAISQEKERLFFTHRKGVVINGTGDDREKITRMKHELEAMGYDTAMIFVNTTDEVSKQRNYERGQRGGREVPEDIRKEKWLDAQKNIGYYQHVFDPFIVVDNSNDMRQLSPEDKKFQEDKLKKAFVEFRKFIMGPIHKQAAQDWIKRELNKRNISQYSGPAKSSAFGKEKPNQMQPRNEETDDLINSLKSLFEEREELTLENYDSIRKILKKLDEETLTKLSEANINFVSKLAKNRLG